MLVGIVTALLTVTFGMHFLADLAGPLDSRLAQSLFDAARCCTCPGCGSFIPDLEPACADCSWWSALAGLWLSIGSAMDLDIKTEDDWRAHFDSLLDADDSGCICNDVSFRHLDDDGHLPQCPAKPPIMVKPGLIDDSGLVP